MLAPMGWGKTTFARYYSEKYPYDFINLDEMAREISPDNLENARIKAGKRFFNKLDDFIEGSKNFLLESTLSGKYMIGSKENYIVNSEELFETFLMEVFNESRKI